MSFQVRPVPHPRVPHPRILAAASITAALLAAPAAAAPVLFALGDSVTFGEDDLVYEPVPGDRGYVSRLADLLARGPGPAARGAQLRHRRRDRRQLPGRHRAHAARGGPHRPHPGAAEHELRRGGRDRDPAAEVPRRRGCRARRGQHGPGHHHHAGLQRARGAGHHAHGRGARCHPRDARRLPRELRGRALHDPGRGSGGAALPAGLLQPLPGRPRQPRGADLLRGGLRPEQHHRGPRGGVRRHLHRRRARAASWAARRRSPSSTTSPRGSCSTEGPFGGELPIGNVHATEAGYGAIAGAFAAELDIAPIPVPAALPLYLGALAGGALVVRRRRRAGHGRPQLGA